MLEWDSWGSSATSVSACLLSAPHSPFSFGPLISMATNCGEVSRFTSGLQRAKAYVQSKVSSAKTESPWAALAS